MSPLTPPSTDHSLDYWLNYLTQLHSSTIDLGLERIKPLAEKMGLSQFSCPVFSVAGTNGKGSCVRFLEAIYCASAFKVAAYTSPHLIRFNERLRINEQDVEDQIWIEAFNAIEQERGIIPLTFFEFTTLAALLICQQADLDVLILEVGLGGRLDAVNIVESDVAIISAIGLDHQDYLGHSREAIAVEKAGIFKFAKEAVCGDFDIPLAIHEAAEKNKVSLYCLNRDFFYQNHQDHWTWTGPEHSYFNLPLLHLKKQNAATCLMAVDLLLDRLPVQEKAIKQALSIADLPGRFERVETPIVPIYLDVAHNPQAAAYLAQKLENSKDEGLGKTLAIFAMLKDKDIAATLEYMWPVVDEWFVAELPVERASSAQDIAKLIGFEGKKCYTFASVREALNAALEHAESSDRIVVFGSFYTVAAAKECLERAIDVAEECAPTAAESVDLSVAKSSLQTAEQDEKQSRGLSVSPKMRHRIIGLLVLLGLAALFLPLLFSKREPIDEVARLARQVPPAPPVPEINLKLSEPVASSTDEEELPSTEATTSPSTPETPSPAKAPEAAAVPVLTNPNPSAVVAATSTTATPKKSETLKLEAEAKSKTKDLSSSLSKESATLTKKAPQAWTLQLGSFANDAAAEALVVKLRGRGFEAYTRQTLSSDRKSLTRVFIGPEIDQAKLKKVQQELAQELKLKGVIRKYTVS